MMKKLCLIFALPILFACKETKKDNGNMETKATENAVIEAIMSRRSIRSYKPEQIKDDELNKLVTCAVNAPSALNKQPWEIRVIQKPELLEAINKGFIAYAEGAQPVGSASRFKEPGFSVFHGAPTLIVVAYDTGNAYGQVDCGWPGQNILLAAESMNIGTCVVGSVVAYLNTLEAKEVLTQLNLPEGYKPLYSIAVGYKNEKPEAKTRNADKVKIIK